MPVDELVRMAAQIVEARSTLVAKLLDDRDAVIEILVKLGPDPERLPAIKHQERQLRQIDEALGILRFGLPAASRGLPQ